MSEEGYEVKALIRPATPEDVSEVTRLMYMAGKSNVEVSLYDIMFPGSMEERLEKLGRLYTAKTRSFYHYSHYLISEVEGKTAGTLCGYNELESGFQKMTEALVEIGLDREQGMAMYESLKPFSRVYLRHPDDAWVIEHVAVSPKYRGNGLMQLLLDEILRKGRELGYRHAELAMLIGNTPAQRAYEKAGFIAADQRTDPDFEQVFGGVGMVRMVKGLY